MKYETELKDYLNIAKVFIALIGITALSNYVANAQSTEEKIDVIYNSVMENSWSKESIRLLQSSNMLLKRPLTANELKPWNTKFYNGTYKFMDAYEYIASLQSGNVPSPAPNQTEPPTSVERYAPQLMAAGMLKNLNSNEKIQEAMRRMRNANLHGLHVVLETSMFAFDPNVRSFADLNGNYDLFEGGFAIMENVIEHAIVYDFHVHFWIFGDDQRRLTPLHTFGVGSSVEFAIYDRINQAWERKNRDRRISFGIGFDCHEWLTIEHAQMIANRLDAPISMRHKEGIYNEIADIPSCEHRTYETADLIAFSDKYADSPMIITEDRCRYKGFDTSNDGHISVDKMKATYKTCKEEGIICIYGYYKADYQHSNPNSPDYRYGMMSDEFPFVFE